MVKIPVKTKEILKERVRLYSRGTVLSYRRSRKNQDENTVLIQLEGVHTRDTAEFYLGKKAAYITNRKKNEAGHTKKINWGKVVRVHGNSGVLRAKFKNNIPPQAFGKRVRVFMYPSNI